MPFDALPYVGVRRDRVEQRNPKSWALTGFLPLFLPLPWHFPTIDHRTFQPPMGARVPAGSGLNRRTLTATDGRSALVRVIGVLLCAEFVAAPLNPTASRNPGSLDLLEYALTGPWLGQGWAHYLYVEPPAEPVVEPPARSWRVAVMLVVAAAVLVIVWRYQRALRGPTLLSQPVR